jgi:hypothetical protein
VTGGAQNKTVVQYSACVKRTTTAGSENIL